MALRAITPNKQFYYIPWCQKHIVEDPKKGRFKTTFILVWPSAKDLAKLENQAMRREQRGFKETTIFEVGTHKLRILKQCVKGWLHLLGDDGHPVKFSDADDEALTKSIDIMPAEMREEVFNHLTGNLRGNRVPMELAAERGVDIDEDLEILEVPSNVPAEDAA
jgi:hypothetical protein